ncbi:MAG TPA: nucleotidyltransferase family protein [Stenotrophomonas sp.]|jgi:molybdenum cofactor cytidylyltransferase
MNTGHAAFVLAAGGSTRLGQPKQCLLRDGETLLHRAARLALETTPKRCLVALGSEAAILCPLLADLPVELVEVDHWRDGLSASLAALRAALGETPVAHVLIVGCDQPALEAAHLRALLDAATRAPSGCAFSTYDGVRGLPAAVAMASLHAATLVGDVGLRALARDGVDDAIGEVDAPALALDIDTPADLAEAISRGWLQPAG